MTNPDLGQNGDGQLRPDAARTISRLQTIIGQQAGQIAQYEDIIEQLQQKITEQAAQIVRLQLPPERTPPEQSEVSS